MYAYGPLNPTGSPVVAFFILTGLAIFGIVTYIMTRTRRKKKDDDDEGCPPEWWNDS